MAQVTLYIKDDLERAARSQARLEKKSLSSYLASLLEKAVHKKEWSPQFLALFKHREVLDIEVPTDAKPEPLEEL